METNISKEERIEIGRKLKTNRLVEQAGYTLGIAAAEGAILLDLLPEGFMEQARAVIERVNEARKDKTLMAEEAKDATAFQNDTATQAKVWRRRAQGRAVRATRFGHAMPDGLLKIGRSRNLAALAGQIKDMTVLFEKNLSEMPGKDPAKLLDEGKTIAQALTAADTDQDVKRGRDLPLALADFFEQKGLLYLALKVINDAGHELYADDAVGAARFNLHILYRRGARRNTESAQASAEV